MDRIPENFEKYLTKEAEEEEEEIAIEKKQKLCS